MACALEGITVVDLGSGPAAALATMLLGDQGARVVRVLDSADDAPRRGGFLVWDRGKECVRTRLADARGGPSEALASLIADADVVVEDFAPASASQALVDADRLARINPRLVACSITAYGKAGPLRDEPPRDDLVLARTGVLSGLPGFRPAPVHLVFPLPSAGAAILAALGIAAALLAREETGRGRRLSTSLMSGALLYHPKVTGTELAPHVFQTHPAGSAPFYSVYECADGGWVQLGCVHAGFISAAARLMGIEDVLAAPRFGGGRGAETPEAEAELRGILARVLRAEPLATWAERFEAADIPFAPARQTEDGLDDPQVRHNEMVVELDDPEVGRLVQMGVPIRLNETPGRVRGPRRLPAAPATAAPPAADTERGPVLRADGPQEPPLAGVRVLEITNLIAGPTGGRLLADLGADVIKLEPPGGDMSRPIARTYFYNVNFNKRSIAVDTSQAAGREAVQRIAAAADALLANLRPGATERMGISRALNPRLIETHITGYGWTGPYAHRPGIDPLAQALMGLSRAQGGPENPPVFAAQLAPTDYTTGALGALGTVLALFVRRRTGVAQRVESNLLNGGIVLSSQWFTRYRGKPTRPLADRGQHGLDAYHRLYRTRDGWIYVSADDERERGALLSAFDAPDAPASAADEAGVHPAAGALSKRLAATLAELGRESALERLRTAAVPCAAVAPGESADFLDGAQAAANEMVAARRHPRLGEMRVAWQYVRFEDSRPSAGITTPLLGEHTAQILAEVGYRESEIADLFAAGTVKTEVTAD